VWPLGKPPSVVALLLSAGTRVGELTSD